MRGDDRRRRPMAWLLILALFVPSAAFLRGWTHNKQGIPHTGSPIGRSTEASTTAFAIAIDTHLVTELAVSGSLGILTESLQDIIFNQTDLIRNDNDDFKSTFKYGIVDSITVASWSYFLVLLAYVAVESFHLDLPIGPDVSLRGIAPEFALTLWIAGTLSTIKRTLFLRFITGEQLGRVELYDRLIDFVIGLITCALVLDELDIDVGMGFKSVLAGSGVGALAFSLASKDLAQQIVGGLVIQAWDAFNIGEDITLGDGTAGTVSKIGLVETELIGYDNIAIRIPNSELAAERISNVSRIKQSRVYQNLRFQYADLDKLPTVLDDIKDEIEQRCPKVILDGSKPFQALLSQYESDHVEAFVNCHFDIPPGSNEFFDNRQQVLLAIATALKKNDVEVALPSMIYQTSVPGIL